MKKSRLHNWLIEIITASLILLFVYTGVSKLNGRDSFRAVLSQSPFIDSYANLFSWLLPLVELGTGLLLFFPFTRKWGLLSALVLMVLFTGYISYMISFAPHLPCLCGGVIKEMTWRQHLIFNIFFMAISAIGLRMHTRNKLFIAINRISRTPV